MCIRFTYEEDIVSFQVEMNFKTSSSEKAVYGSKKKKRFCDHCDRLVSIRTFNAHKRRKTVDNNGSNHG